MKTPLRLSRRRFVHNLAAAGLAGLLPLPSWTKNLTNATTANKFALEIATTPVLINGKSANATGVNGTVPGPLLRMREGERVTIDVRNGLDADSSIHWHGLLLPSAMDGVPGLSFAGIRPKESYQYEFELVQNGTYWYHSHSGFQEQTGVYGPMIIEPRDPDAVNYDVEHVVMLSDWTFEDPNKIYAKLKKTGRLLQPTKAHYRGLLS